MWRSIARSLDLEIYLLIYLVIYLVIDASLASSAASRCSSVSFFSFSSLITWSAQAPPPPWPVNIAGMACQP